MRSFEYIAFDQLVADLESENSRRESRVRSPFSVAQIIGRHGQVTFDGFSPDERPGPLMLPTRPDIDRIEVGSRVTLLSAEESDNGGVYFTSVLLVLDVRGDSVDGYVFQSSQPGHGYRRVTVSKAKVIDCHPPLGTNEVEVADFVDDGIPF